MNLVQHVIALLVATVPATSQQTELQRIVAPPPPNGKQYYNFDVGGAVAISDEWAAVADRTVDDSFGEVYMYRRTSTGWMFRQRLFGEFQSGFGVALAIDGDTLIVGGWIWSGYLGKVYVFKWTGATWMKTQEILPDGFSSPDSPRFGRSVALSGNVLAVGLPSVDSPVHDGGEVRIYERPGNSWMLAERFQLPPIPAVLNGEYFALGISVAVSGNTVVAGAQGNLGAACVYERNSSGWYRAAILENPSSAGGGDSFGASVDIWEDTLVVGRPDYDPDPDPGKAYVYQRDSSDNWILQQVIRASDGFGGGDYGDRFGSSTALARSRLFVGAYNGESTGHKNGAVYVFNHHAGGWNATEDYQLVASDPPDMGFAQVGYSVAAYENFILAGAPGCWDEGIREGVAYAFAVDLGDAYCTPAESDATLGITGSEAAADQNLTLTIRGAPANARGLFLLSASSGSVPFGNDLLCLGAPILRVAYALTGPEGVALYDLDFDTAWLAGQLVSGSTWYFQFAHERHTGAGRLDLLTNAVSLTLQ